MRTYSFDKLELVASSPFTLFSEGNQLCLPCAWSEISIKLLNTHKGFSLAQKSMNNAQTILKKIVTSFIKCNCLTWFWDATFSLWRYVELLKFVFVVFVWAPIIFVLKEVFWVFHRQMGEVPFREVAGHVGTGQKFIMVGKPWWKPGSWQAGTCGNFNHKFVSRAESVKNRGKWMDQRVGAQHQHHKGDWREGRLWSENVPCH